MRKRQGLNPGTLVEFREQNGKIVIIPRVKDYIETLYGLSTFRIKTQFPISYADALAVSLAQELSAAIVTGDPEFKQIESLLTVLWI